MWHIESNGSVESFIVERDRKSKDEEKWKYVEKQNVQMLPRQLLLDDIMKQPARQPIQEPLKELVICSRRNLLY